MIVYFFSSHRLQFILCQRSGLSSVSAAVYSHFISELTSIARLT